MNWAADSALLQLTFSLWVFYFEGLCMCQVGQNGLAIDDGIEVLELLNTFDIVD